MALTLAEGLYLIALDDEEGRVIPESMNSIDKGLIAACVFDLYLQKKIQLDEQGIVSSVGNTSAGNKMLNDILKFVAQKPIPITDFVSWAASNYPDIQLDIMQMLTDRGIIKREATKLFWIPISERMENADYSFEREIRTALHTIAVNHVKGPPTLIVLLKLIEYCNLISEVFSNKDEEIIAKRFLKSILDKGWVDEPTKTSLELLAPYFRSN